MVRFIRGRSIVLALAVGGICGPAMAEVWDSGGADSNWGTALNWDTNLVPANNGTANLSFGSGAKLAPVVNINWDAASVTFFAGAPAFSIGGNSLTVRGGGITNNSTNPQTFSNTVVAGGTQTWTAGGAGLNFSGAESIAGSSVLTVAGASNTSLLGPIIGTGALTKTGNGTLVLGSGAADAAANTFSGLTTLNAGTLTLDKATGVAAINGDLVMNGGTLLQTRTGNISSNSNLTMNFGLLNGGGGIVSIGTFSFSAGSFGGVAAITVNSTAAAAFTMNANFNSALPVAVNFAGASGGGFAQTGNGVINMLSPINLGNVARPFAIGDIAAVADDQVISGLISNGGIIKNGLGTLALLGANTYSGGTTINGGYVRVTADNGLGAAGSALTMAGGFGLATSASFTLTHPIGGTNAAITTAPGTTLTMGAAISSNGFGKNGDGTLLLPAANPSLTGPFSANAGTLALGNDAALGTSSLSLNATLRADGNARVLSNTVSFYDSTIEGPLDMTFTGILSSPFGAARLIVNNNTTFKGPLVPDGVWSAGIFKAGTGTLVLMGDNTITDAVIVEAGTLELAGGHFDGEVLNYSTFRYTAGGLNGLLYNLGTVDFNALNTHANGGVTNLATMRLASHKSLEVLGPGLSNQGTFILTNGYLYGDAPKTNDGLVSGSGTIDATVGGFQNNGQITPDGTLEVFGAVNSAGQIDVGTADQLRTNNALTNSGMITLAGGQIAGNGPLNNISGGTITGHGIVSTALGTSSGNIVVTSGTLNIVTAFTNAGAIQAGGLTATLAGGAITNTGTIEGFGTIANVISNTTGSIEAAGGTLILSGAGAASSGLMAASAGNKILFTKGLAVNAGTISLTGGTFDNGNNPMSNTGQISGYGTFRSGGLTNNGSITFTGGVSTINGNVINAATKKVEVRYTPAIFTGTFTNNGIFKNTSAQVTFSGTYIENGTFLSDPADNFFGNVIIGEAGAWSGGVGDRFVVSGDLMNHSLAKDIWQTSAAELRFAGGAAHTYSAAGSDLGVSYAGYEDNFAWGRLVLGAGETLNVDGDAIYVRTLELAGGLTQISSITGAGNIYYDLGAPGNAYLGGKSYELAGGGMIAAVPEPGLAAFLIFGLGLIARRRQRISCI